MYCHVDICTGHYGSFVLALLSFVELRYIMEAPIIRIIT